MNLFKRWLKKREDKKESGLNKQVARQEVENEWIDIPEYISIDPKEELLVSLVVTAIAADDAPNSQFRIKKIYQKNPEAKLVSLITASIAAGEEKYSQFIIKKISKKRQEEHDVTKI